MLPRFCQPQTRAVLSRVQCWDRWAQTNILTDHVTTMPFHWCAGRPRLLLDLQMHFSEILKPGILLNPLIAGLVFSPCETQYSQCAVKNREIV